MAHRSHHDDQHAQRHGDEPAVPHPTGGALAQGGAEGHAAGADHRGPAPQHRAARRSRRTQGHGAEPPEQQLPHAGVGAEIGAVGPEHVGGEAHPQRRSGCQQRGPDGERPDGPTAPEPDEAHEEQRPHQVVLLLYGQRPRVQERVGGLEVCEVVVSRRHLLPVGEVEECRHRGGAQLGRHHARDLRPGRRGPAPPGGGAGPGAGAGPGGPRRHGGGPRPWRPARTAAGW